MDTGLSRRNDSGGGPLSCSCDIHFLMSESGLGHPRPDTPKHGDMFEIIILHAPLYCDSH